jgi:hypothetical protein
MGYLSLNQVWIACQFSKVRLIISLVRSNRYLSKVRLTGKLRIKKPTRVSMATPNKGMQLGAYAI